MPAFPSDLPPASTGESPIDRALTLLLADDHEGALRWSAALVDREPTRPTSLLVAARSMAALGEHAVALDALDVCIRRAIDSGNLPVAVAACCELRSLGADPSQRFDDIARCFSKDSERLLDKGALPPRLPGQEREFEPLDPELAGKALLAAAEQTLRRARELLEADGQDRDCDPKVSHHSLFSSLGATGLRAMISVFDLITVPAGHVVIEEDTIGAEAFILARGEVEVIRSAPESADADHKASIRLARLASGALFGEMALLSRSPRAASVIATRPSLILVATKDALDQVAAREPEVGNEFAEHCRRRMVENLVRTSSILSAVKSSERPSLVEGFVTRTFEQGEKVIVQGQESDGLYLVASGEVAIVLKEGDDSTIITKLGPGEVVGEVALVLRRPATADVIAEHPTITLHLPRERFHDLIKKHPAVLAELYDLAVRRQEETSSIVAQDATDIDEFVLV